MEEIWRDIPGYEGRYQVSNMGRVKSLGHVISRRNLLTGGRSHVRVADRLLKPQPQPSGHLYVKIGHKPARHFRVHRLVALAFLGPCPSGMEVCHNDSDPTNNRVDNLRYDTRSGNRLDMVRKGNEGRQILRVEQVARIRERLAEGESCRALAAEYGVHPSTISKINTRVNFGWLE